MRTKKARKFVLERALEGLSEKAAECTVLAKVQRASADKQHEGAHKLESLSHALEVDAAEIRSELDDEDKLRPPSSSPSAQN